MFINAQQDPLFSSDVFTPIYNNPASVGTWNVFSANMAYRNQWPEVSNSYQSFLATSEAEVCFSNTSGACNFKLGMGLSFMFEQFGGSKFSMFNVPINYGINFENSVLTIGVSPGLKSYLFGVDWIPPQTLQDSLIPGSSRVISFDMGVGVMWYGDNFFVGASITHLINPSSSLTNFSTARHYYAHGGYRFKAKNNYIFPIIKMYAVDAFFTADILCFYQTKNEYFSVGAGYRLGAAYLISVAAKYKKIRLAYHFDLYRSKIDPLRTGHEFRLSYIFSKQDRTGINEGI